MTYSYSKLALFKQCPHKFKLTYIDKIPEPGDNSALIKGSKIHSLLENFETYDKTSEYTTLVENFANSQIGKDILSKNSIREHCVKFDAELNANDSLKKKEAYFIGYIDRINISQTIELIDYKTGKYKDPKWQDYEQLSIYALYIFSKYPQVQEIKLRYVYVEHSKENSKVLKRSDADKIKKSLQETINLIELCNSTKQYPKKPQRLCDWCGYKTSCLSGFDDIQNTPKEETQTMQSFTM